MTLTKMYWLLGQKSKLSTSSNILIYKVILKPVLTYGIQLRGTDSTSDIEILESFHSKVLRMNVDASWYVPNTVIRRDLQHQQLKEKSVIVALYTLGTSVYTQTT
jgi:spore coat protein CotF